MHTKGIYKTKTGHKAIVAQVISVDHMWFLKGAVVNCGVYQLCMWHIDGEQIHGVEGMDLGEKVA